MARRTAIAIRMLALAALGATLSACSSGNNDLRAYIDDIKARPGGRIEPLPQVEPAPSHTYVAAERRSPFAPDVPQARVSRDPNAVSGPDMTRAREFLEQFPLDTLRMVGTLTQQSARYGLLQTTDGLIHRVTVGNHIGQNFGRILAISEAQIQVVEIIPDGLGGFIERPAAIALSSN
jgi:type IV pilus assembly protein PilP